MDLMDYIFDKQRDKLGEIFELYLKMANFTDKEEDWFFTVGFLERMAKEEK